MRRLLVFAVSAFMLAAAMPALAGELVKTTGNPAVYYRADDGKRYVFPNAATYASWYGDFSGVRTISAAELVSLPIGGNVTSRPGARLVKIQTDPKVYAVEAGGRLRWLTTEAIAAAAYGTDWNRQVDDVPDVFFVDYELGAAISPEAPHDRAGALSGAANIDADLGRAATAAPPSVPTFALAPSGTLLSSAAERPLITLKFHSASAARLTALEARLYSLTGATSRVPDDDPGGLVRGLGERANLKDVRWVDDEGRAVFGALDLALATAQDQEQILRFGGTYDVPAGHAVTLRLMARVDQDVPTGEKYRVMVAASGISVADPATGLPARFLPSSDLQGEPVTVLQGGLGVAHAPEQGNETYVRGERGVSLAAFAFTASEKAATTLKALSFVGYIDAQDGGPGFMQGADVEPGSVVTAVRAVVPTVSLHDASGARLAGPVAVELGGRAPFRGLSYVIPQGETRTLFLKGDLAPSVEVEAAPDKIAFDLPDASADVEAFDSAGVRVEAAGDAPNGGTSPRAAATVLRNGVATFRWEGRSTQAVIGREADLGELSVETKEDAFILRTLSFVSNGPTREAMPSLKLRYLDASGASLTAAAEFAVNTATFRGLEIPVARDATTRVSVLAPLSMHHHVPSGERLSVIFGDTVELQFSSVVNGEAFDKGDLGANGLTVALNRASSLTVRNTDLTFARAAATPKDVIGRSGDEETFRFVVTAGPEGAARLKKLTFELKPGDVGAIGADNDSLERWADANGDLSDDNAVANLRRLDTGEVIGDGSDARLSFSWVRAGGLADATPQGLDSEARDVGMLEYLFSDGFEPLIEAGTTLTLALEVDTAEFAPGTWPLEVGLLGGASHTWFDTASGVFDGMEGAGVLGLPLEAPALTVR